MSMMRWNGQIPISLKREWGDLKKDNIKKQVSFVLTVFSNQYLFISIQMRLVYKKCIDSKPGYVSILKLGQQQISNWNENIVISKFLFSRGFNNFKIQN